MQYADTYKACIYDTCVHDVGTHDTCIHDTYIHDACPLAAAAAPPIENMVNLRDIL